MCQTLYYSHQARVYCTHPPSTTQVRQLLRFATSLRDSTTLALDGASAVNAACPHTRHPFSAYWVPTPREPLLQRLPSLQALASALRVPKEPPAEVELTTRTSQTTQTSQTNSHPLVILYIHGGAFAVGSALTYRSFFSELLRRCSRVVGATRLLTVEYTLAPDAHHPVQLREVAAAYAWLVGQGYRVVVAGDSAGGNLALALALRLRGGAPLSPVQLPASLPQPIGCVLISPWCDLSREYGAEVTSPHDYLTVSRTLVCVVYLFVQHSTGYPLWTGGPCDDNLLGPCMVESGASVPHRVASAG